MKSFLIVVSLSIIALQLFYSCVLNHEKEEKSSLKLSEVQIEDKKTSFHPIHYSTDSVSNNQNFQIFWDKYRNVVLDSNLTALADVVKIPFYVEGFQDQDPQLKLKDLDSIKKIFKVFLKAEIVSIDSFSTHFQLIKKFKNPDTIINIIGEKYNLLSFNNEKTNCRIENMVFLKVKNNWKLIQVYMETRKLKKSDS